MITAEVWTAPNKRLRQQGLKKRPVAVDASVRPWMAALAMERSPARLDLPSTLKTGSMEDNVVQIIAAALLTATKVAGPVLFATLAIGLVLSIVQSATQIQEQTLTFVPKLIVAAVVLVLTGGWCLRVLEGFTRELFTMIPALLAS